MWALLVPLRGGRKRGLIALPGGDVAALLTGSASNILPSLSGKGERLTLRALSVLLWWFAWRTRY